MTGLLKKYVAPTCGSELSVCMDVSPLSTMIGTSGPSVSRSFWLTTRPLMSGRWMSTMAAANRPGAALARSIASAPRNVTAVA